MRNLNFLIISLIILVAINFSNNFTIAADDKLDSSNNKPTQSGDLSKCTNNLINCGETVFCGSNRGGDKSDKSAKIRRIEAVKHNYNSLWQTALNYLSDYPLIIADKKNGSIITDWKQSLIDENKMLKIKINVTKPNIEENIVADIEVEVLVKKYIQGKWLYEGKDEIKAGNIKKQILKKNTE